VPLLPAHADRPVTVSAQPYGCFTWAVRIPGVGQGQIVASAEPVLLTGRAVGLVTNRSTWRAAQRIGLYRHRWPTETCSQDRQGLWGFTASRRRRAEALGQLEVWSSWPPRGGI
jgi:hypothetical protein